MHSIIPISLTAISLLPGLAAATPNSPFCGIDRPKTIESTQPLQGNDFIGAAVCANRLHPKFVHQPMSASLHIDNGNTRTVDYPGPLGRNLSVTFIDIHYAQFFWDVSGMTFAAYGGPCNGNNSDIVSALAVLDPETLEFETVWQPPKKYAKSRINLTYLQVLMETDEIVLNTQDGQMFILHKHQRANGSPILRLRRTIDLEPSGVLAGNTLLNTLMDAAGNIWFTTGGLGPAGAATTNMTVVGYVERDDTVHSMQLADQAVENGPAVSNTTFFFSVGPTGANDHANASGSVSALQPGPGTSINVVWNATYDAGSGKKPGSFARGSGTTPALLGDDFVAIADNADGQINMLIFRQNAIGNDQKPVCKLPLFQPGASHTDNAAIVHWDGENYGVVMQNMYNNPQYVMLHSDTNGPWNNLTGQAPGISKYFVAGDGSGCHLEWTNPSRQTTDLTLSTATGLLYGYEQSEELADEGEYVWYASAIDWMSGETVWKDRAGAGGIFNNFYRTTFLSPDGALIQPVEGGVVIVRDDTAGI